MRKSTKILLTLLLLVALVLAGIVAVPYYVFGIDIFDRSGWITTESGETQYLDYHGDPLTDWQLIDEKWYYFDKTDATLVTGWLELDGDRYYLTADGTRHIGWLELADGTYYIRPSMATAATGWLELEEGTYYMDAQGRKQSGWQEIEGSRYYLDENGLLVTGWQELDGNHYYLGTDGAMFTGWLEDEGGSRYLDENGILRTGWTDTDLGRFYLTEEGYIATGWLETDEGTIYLDENGQPITGWIELENGTYYLTDTGVVTTGWLELDGERYYFREDGTMARGKVLIGENASYFTSTGKHVQMVNKWNPVPDDYQVELVSYGGYQIAAEAYDPLVQMIEQLKGLGYYKVTSIYRSVQHQQNIWDSRYYNYLAAGYSHDGAIAEVGKHVAVPGTSEHHLGLAVDIDGVAAVHGWLAEHSWEYGFIVRYPDGKTDITGIVYEPWHYRYVGRELAKEIYESGLTMEEYMDRLTEQEGYGAGTASDPDRY